MNVLEKMGIFSTIVKRYVKTVDPPVSDHGGLFVKEVRTHLLLEENYPLYFLEEKLGLTAAGFAQSVERLTAEREVAGSIPVVGPILGVLE